jgi:hypothetical protein
MSILLSLPVLQSHSPSSTPPSPSNIQLLISCRRYATVQTAVKSAAAITPTTSWSPPPTSKSPRASPRKSPRPPIVARALQVASVRIAVRSFLHPDLHRWKSAAWTRHCSWKTCADVAIGTTLFRFGDSFGGPDGMRIIKAGILDDVNIINNTKPGAELFAPERIKWVPALDNAGQIDAMPPS